MLERKKDYHAWLYLGVPLLLMAIFTFYPLIRTMLIAFDQGYDDSFHQFSFNFGFSHFGYLLFSDFPWFKTTLVNTLIVVFISVPISTILALLIAVALNSIKPLQKIFQTIFFLPYVTNTIAIGMVFAVLFNLDSGLVNSFLGMFGIDPVNWINSGDAVNGVAASTTFNKMLVLQIYIIWNALPFKILLFIGGLQSIGKQYYDAAKIDSTPKNKVFRKITIPLLSPIISYVLITSFIGAFKTYDSVIGIFGGDWSKTKEIQTVVGFVYNQLNPLTAYGGPSGTDAYALGAAASVILFAIIMTFTAINLYVSKKRVHY
ncbi:Sugar ABC-type transport system, permease component [Alteracholeplasma palmae J233]|uniref:Sugar ABC-type transport system, permease component n=1 Tax=Alteracholeplasma palmae (strain ATCC 49389 / J233) TaxID=1318466 RepID=U4KLV6_ALTPJ|nr:sugar ABC transporter permease [Alteracholeplasma palmae]CCV64999.1 Sugar ABC-type transport system, permease component [Alteracholeplasma palmae J233]